MRLGLIAFLLLVPGPVLAQTAPPPAAAPAPAPPPVDSGGARTHDGFFFRLGLNFGPLIVNDAIEPATANSDDAKWSGLHLGSDVMFGGTPAKGLVIGGFLMYNQTSGPTLKTGSVEQSPDGTLFFVGIGAFANYYFDPKAGFHLQGLFGFSGLDFVSSGGASGGNDPFGFMFGLGAGYDFFFADEWSVGPFARFIYSSLSAESGGLTRKATYMYPSLGVAITLH